MVTIVAFKLFPDCLCHVFAGDIGPKVAIELGSRPKICSFGLQFFVVGRQYAKISS